MIGAVQGRRIIEASWVGTALFVVTALAATVAVGPARSVAVAVALGLFAVGCLLFLWAFWLAVQRSRTEEIGIGGLFFLAGKDTAPARPKWLLLGSLSLEVVTAIVTASIRPYTSLAFGLLVPVFGLACTGLWGARYGRFGPRVHRAAPGKGGDRSRRDVKIGPGDAPEPSQIGQNVPHG